MIRLPTPPKNIGAPLPVLDYYNKMNEMIAFQQALVKNLETQQTQTDFSQSASIKQSENASEAKGWFIG
tara:strand:+ start:175 stop:381 length:207 start_codon:yes stop_codon:yes gene_type:complete